MPLQIAVIFSFLLVFFLDVRVNSFLNELKEDHNYNVEMDARNQSLRNLQQIRASIRFEVDEHGLRYKEYINKDFIHKSLAQHGHSYVGGSNGDIFAINLENETIFYNTSLNVKNNTPIDKVLKSADTLGGSTESMQLAWIRHLNSKKNNPPNDRVTWNYNGQEEWLVCLTIPDSMHGFHGLNHSSEFKDFKIKICQRIIKNQVRSTWDQSMAKLDFAKEHLLDLIKAMIALFLIAVVWDFFKKRYLRKIFLEKKGKRI